MGLHCRSANLSCEVELHVQRMLYVTIVPRLCIRYDVLFVASCLRTLKQTKSIYLNHKVIGIT